MEANQQRLLDLHAIDAILTPIVHRMSMDDRVAMEDLFFKSPTQRLTAMMSVIMPAALQDPAIKKLLLADGAIERLKQEAIARKSAEIAAPTAAPRA